MGGGGAEMGDLVEKKIRVFRESCDTVFTSFSGKLL
jgi:hypothetical protein